MGWSVCKAAVSSAAIASSILVLAPAARAVAAIDPGADQYVESVPTGAGPGGPRHTAGGTHVTAAVPRSTQRAIRTRGGSDAAALRALLATAPSGTASAATAAAAPTSAARHTRAARSRHARTSSGAAAPAAGGRPASRSRGAGVAGASRPGGGAPVAVIGLAAALALISGVMGVLAWRRRSGADEEHSFA